MATYDIESLKQYVRMEDHKQYQKLAPGIVSLHISHNNLKQTWPEIRVDLHTTIGALKDRLYRHCGTAAGFQKLLLRDNGKTLCELLPDDRMLGYFGVQSGMEIHIVDNDSFSFSKNGGLENISLVEKFVMSDADYDKRPDSIRNYKKKMRETDPYFTLLPENRREPSVSKAPGVETLEPFNVGDRCEVAPGSRRGRIEWKGLCPVIGPGAWIGVKLDEPLGKCDGSVGFGKHEKRLFTCEQKYGAFVRPDKCTVGDFAEIDPLDELSSEDEI